MKYLAAIVVTLVLQTLSIYWMRHMAMPAKLDARIFLPLACVAIGASLLAALLRDSIPIRTLKAALFSVIGYFGVWAYTFIYVTFVIKDGL